MFYHFIIPHRFSTKFLNGNAYLNTCRVNRVYNTYKREYCKVFFSYLLHQITQLILYTFATPFLTFFVGWFCKKWFPHHPFPFFFFKLIYIYIYIFKIQSFLRNNNNNDKDEMKMFWLMMIIDFF